MADARGELASSEAFREGRPAATAARPPVEELTGVTVTGRRRPEPIGEYQYERANKKNSNFISFPIDIEKQDNLPYVIFYVYDTVTAPITGAVTGDRTGASLKSGFQVAESAVSSAAEVVDRQALLGIGSSVATAVVGGIDDLAKIAGIKTSSNNVSSLLKERFKGFSLKRNIQKSSDAIVLFMPDSLQANYEHNYDEISVTATLGAYGMLAQAISDNAGGADKATDPYILEAASKAAGALPGVQSSEELTNLLLFGTTGKAINPQMEVLYNSPRLRTFTFDFRLVPRSQKEAIAVQNIVNKFKYFAAPSITKNTSGRFYTPPSRFVMEFHHRGNENPYLFKTQQCVLESISIDYAPNGYASHYDGAPVETRVQLIFKETIMISREDLDPSGFGGGATY